MSNEEGEKRWENSMKLPKKIKSAVLSRNDFVCLLIIQFIQKTTEMDGVHGFESYNSTYFHY